MLFAFRQILHLDTKWEVIWLSSFKYFRNYPVFKFETLNVKFIVMLFLTVAKLIAMRLVS